jgi:hypothetical protein
MELLENFYLYACAFLKIQTKDGRLLPFELKLYQQRIIDAILKEQASGRPVRIIILKGRQMGISTVIAAFFFWWISTRHNSRLVVIADIASRTDAVFGIYKRFLDNLPSAFIKPMIDTNNDREIHYQNPKKHERIKNPGLDSMMKAETAQDPQAGRSGTAIAAHKSEAAYFPYPGEIDMGLGGSIPFTKDTFIIEESTANGIAGSGAHFATRWEQAVAGLNGYIAIFVAWFEAEEYEFPLADDFDLTDEEIELDKDMCNASDLWKSFKPEAKMRKLNWRRYKLQEFAADTTSVFTPLERFNQEFPYCPEVAFNSSGNPVFEVDKLKKQIQQLAKTPPRIIDISSIVEGTFLEDYLRGLRVYNLPVKGLRYVIAADVSEGLENRDASHIKVIDSKMREVACWHGLIDPDLLGELMVGLGYLYNTAMLCPEINNMGHTTLSTIKRMSYPSIYQRERRDQYTDKITLELGWRTTAKNKNPMIANLKAAHREGDVTILDIETLREMTKVERDAKGHIEINGRDRTAALCIALEAFKQLPLIPEKKDDAKPSLFAMTPEARRKVYAKKESQGYFK